MFSMLTRYAEKSSGVISAHFDATVQLGNTYIAFVKYLKEWENKKQGVSSSQILSNFIFRVGRRSYIIF